MNDHHATRRTFLAQLTATVIGSVPLLSSMTGCTVSGLTVYQCAAQDGLVALNISEYPELFLIHGAVQLDINEHSSPIVVIRTDVGKLVALSPICTHLGCTVRKEPTLFRCPCHGSTYALNGTVVRGPAEMPLQSYQVEQRDDQLIIHL